MSRRNTRASAKLSKQGNQKDDVEEVKLDEVTELKAQLAQAQKDKEELQKKLNRYSDDNSDLNNGGKKGEAPSIHMHQSGEVTILINQQKQLIEKVLALKEKSSSSSQFKLEAITPEELHYAEANKDKKLEQWLFKVERMLKQQEMMDKDFTAQMKLIENYWDKPLVQWWQGEETNLKKAGNSIKSFKEFEKFIKKYFVTTTEEDTAFSEIKKVEMKTGETMLDYTKRVVDLANKISSDRASSEIIADFMIDGIPTIRFPFLVTSIRKEQAETRNTNNGKGMTLEVTRNKIMGLAKNEPSEALAEARRISQSSSSSNSSNSTTTNKQNNSNKIKPTANYLKTLAEKLNTILTSGATVDNEGNNLLSEEDITAVSALSTIGV
jgi:hypothetical protein